LVATWRAVREGWKEAGFTIPEGKLSIQSTSSLQFAEQGLHMPRWQTSVMQTGYSPEFKAEPGPYYERNNRSAVIHSDAVTEKLAKWLAEGHVEEVQGRPHCCNPLSVVAKMDPDTKEIKKRVVLDMSRHINNHLVPQDVQLDDLKATEALRSPGDRMCIFDLENQYFHVRLATEAKRYFGFSWKDEAGVDRYYIFTVMVYGFAAAAAVVTRLIKPIMGFVHQSGVRASIYMDDGNIVGSTQEEAEEATQLVLDCMQLAGWNIQWAKTSPKAVTVCKYLGFVINLEDFTYRASDGKLRKVEIMLMDLAQAAEQGEPVDAKHLAAVLGNVIALRTSHGSVVQHMTKELQHELCAMVHQFDWDCQLMLGKEAQTELVWLQSNLARFNGKGIRNERGQEAVHKATAVSREAIETMAEQEQIAAEGLRSASFTLKLNQEIEFTEDLPDGTAEGWQQAFHELDTIAGLMQQQDSAAEHAHWKDGSGSQVPGIATSG
jgi:hypothetical protein